MYFDMDLLCTTVPIEASQLLHPKPLLCDVTLCDERVMSLVLQYLPGSVMIDFLQVITIK
jgi:hypothetical protein